MRQNVFETYKGFIFKKLNLMKKGLFTARYIKVLIDENEKEEWNKPITRRIQSKAKSKNGTIGIEYGF